MPLSPKVQTEQPEGLPTREHLIMMARGLQEQVAKADAKIRHEQQERSKIVKMLRRKELEIARFDVGAV